jgi:hypothetical protein
MATIESLADDMGGGRSWCSNCKYGLDRYLNNYFSASADKRAETGLLPEKDLSTFLQKNKREIWRDMHFSNQISGHSSLNNTARDIMECPECEYELNYSSGKLEPYAFGGSDF